jgi:hypothetical protein
MKNLVYILNNIAERDKFGNIETHIIETLHDLSEIIIEPDIGEDESRISAYIDDLGEFIEGLKEGYEQNKHDFLDQEFTPYCYGHSIGHNIQNRIAEGKNKKIEVEEKSFQNFYEQLSNVAVNIKSELEDLMLANQNPYNFLLNQIYKDKRYDLDTPNKLTELLCPYQSLIEYLSLGTSDGRFDEQLREMDKLTVDELTQLSIVYLFRDNPNIAQDLFYQARGKLSNDDRGNPIVHIASNTHIANRIFQSAYSQIKFAQEFEKVEAQYNSQSQF